MELERGTFFPPCWRFLPRQLPFFFLFLFGFTLLSPQASEWISLAALPRSLLSARASVVGGRLRVTGGWHGNAPREEVTKLD